MKEQLENTANEVLRGLIDNAASMKDFILSEAPEVIQQLLIWKGAESFIYFSTCIMIWLSIVINTVKILKYGEKHKWRDSYYDGDEKVETVIIPWVALSGMCCVIFFFTSLLLFNLTWLKVWLAPKVYLIEYAADLVK